MDRNQKPFEDLNNYDSVNVREENTERLLLILVLTLFILLFDFRVALNFNIVFVSVQPVTMLHLLTHLA